MQKIQEILPLYFVAGTQDCRHLGENKAQNLLSVLKQALEGGITCFQFRDKGKFSLEHSPEEQKALAIACRDMCREYGVPFIVNDNVDLAFELEADGVHVGQTDMAVEVIRAKAKQAMIVGWSVNVLEEAKMGETMAEIDYFGIGPIFPTNSKENAKPTRGMAFVQELRNAGITKPFVAIGGVKWEHVRTLRELGADGVALISAICQAENVETMTKALRVASLGENT
ncbi:thiamine-phosphate diphosphorylase [Rodentibacter rarus]|uniref:thiamine phosphate synthase n=1 Tax=Rodentibacter rarus TaxID=1908260 RepID=UPI000985144D|nr:thiamine phosphate synthase [Rodentibacter rarus]OOF40818.1 thiamine-phosphate diphosphorylase [Rodentibacter rarus]